MPGLGGAHRPQPGARPRLRPAPERDSRRRAHRAPHLHQHPQQRRRRPDEQLDGSRRRARQADAALPRRHERPDDVCRALPDGPGRLAVLEGRRRDHRQPLRRLEHAADDPRRPGRARRAEGLRRLHALPALARRPVARSPLHRAFPRRERGVVDRVGLRRQRAAREEVPGAAAGQLDGARRGLARRAHADSRPAVAGGPHLLRHRRLSVGVRQDQPGDAGAAGLHAGLEDLDGRRRHRVAAARTGRTAVGGQSGGRLLRRRSGHESLAPTRRRSR